MAHTVDIFDLAAGICPDNAISPLDLTYDVKGEKAVRLLDGDNGADVETVSSHADVVATRVLTMWAASTNSVR